MTYGDILTDYLETVR